MADHVNLLKLCVGADTVADLTGWQAARFGAAAPVHVTRSWPKRSTELLNGGSLYWVFRGLVLARQRIARLEQRLGADGITRCGIVFEPQVILTEAMPRRPFQGWRYLEPKDAPHDLKPGRAGDPPLPRELLSALAEIGLR